MPKKFAVATIKTWNVENYDNLRKNEKNFQWFLMTKKEDLKLSELKAKKPDYIFFPHWSWIIPEEIWSNFNCVVFHMTDLPYGRGGSPLQNLIVRGKKETKISAIKVGEGMDTGDIYIKEKLNLNGSAEDIYKRASKIIFERMIPYIIKNNPTPQKQVGKAVNFKRRKPGQSKISGNMGLDKVYDLIRMLDAEGYPRAFLETKKLKFDFSKVKKEKNKLIAKIEIYEK